MNNIILGFRKFSPKDQIKFISFSGDNNPVHSSKEYSLRTSIGQPIVHGLNILLWSMECFEKKYPMKKKIKTFEQVDFLNHLNLNEKVTCVYNKKKNTIIVKNLYSELVKIKLESNSSDFNFKNQKELIKKKTRKIHNNTIDKFKPGMKINYPVYADQKYAKKLFPLLSRRYGIRFVTFIANISSIIGMYVPGKSSMLLSINLKKDNLFKNNKIKVLRVDKRFSLIDLKILDGNFNIMIRSIFRPNSKKINHISNIKKKLTKINFFKNKKILIIGGSRGFGAYLVKILSLLECKILFTYKTSKKSGNQILNEINQINKNVRLVKFDVINPNLKLILKFNPEYLFYFSTPKIFVKRSNNFEDNLYKEFSLYYFKAFSNILSKLNSSSLKLVYYPSTIAIEESPDKYPEYVKSKLIGEKVAKKIAKKKNIKLIIDRLPRSSTDQTMSHLNIKTTDPLKLMLNVINKIYICSTKK